MFGLRPIAHVHVIRVGQGDIAGGADDPEDTTDPDAEDLIA
jgi:hypothetical protein